MATGMHTKLKYLLLLLLLSSLVTLKVFAIQHIDIATEQSFRYLELTQAKIGIFINMPLQWVVANTVDKNIRM